MIRFSQISPLICVERKKDVLQFCSSGNSAYEHDKIRPAFDINKQKRFRPIFQKVFLENISKCRSTPKLADRRSLMSTHSRSFSRFKSNKRFPSRILRLLQTTGPPVWVKSDPLLESVDFSHCHNIDSNQAVKHSVV